ncbi:MAG: hypothetical protein AAF211_03095 [Myxococcota bacterium]
MIPPTLHRSMACEGDFRRSRAVADPEAGQPCNNRDRCSVDLPSLVPWIPES